MTRGVEKIISPRLMAWKNKAICTLWSQLELFSTFFGVEAKVGVEATFQQYQYNTRYHTFHACSENEFIFIYFGKIVYTVETWKRGSL